MKMKMFIAAIALLISAGITAQTATPAQTQTKAQTQTQTATQAQTQSGTQVQTQAKTQTQTQTQTATQSRDRCSNSKSDCYSGLRLEAQTRKAAKTSSQNKGASRCHISGFCRKSSDRDWCWP